MRKVQIDFIPVINGLYGFKHIISSRALQLHPKIYLNDIIEQPIYNEIFRGVKIHVWGNLRL